MNSLALAASFAPDELADRLRELMVGPVPGEDATSLRGERVISGVGEQCVDRGPDDAGDVARPQIYFGERTDNYVIVDTQVGEFDYPRGSAGVESRFEGDSGVRLGGLPRRAILPPAVSSAPGRGSLIPANWYARASETPHCQTPTSR